MALVYLNTLAHGRSGDKGDTSNVCVYARDPKDYEFLKRVLTVERYELRHEARTGRRRYTFFASGYTGQVHGFRFHADESGYRLVERKRLCGRHPQICRKSEVVTLKAECIHR